MGVLNQIELERVRNFLREENRLLVEFRVGPAKIRREKAKENDYHMKRARQHELSMIVRLHVMCTIQGQSHVQTTAEGSITSTSRVPRYLYTPTPGTPPHSNAISLLCCRR